MYMCYFNFNNMKYSVCKIYLLFAVTSNCSYVYSFHPVEPLIIKHVISMATSKLE